ncbi:CHASE2 domain-containing protein [Deinococcus sonorensis]|uniref:CHASE2 domain-containing protein n=2 Tax=Deinococcus sonorensis TaxID=309891 RepID=A0AAU7UDM2_9DEIO
MLRESGLAVLVFLLLSWAATEGRLGWFSDTLADAQDKAYDVLAGFEYQFASPVAPPPGTPRVVFVDIDQATVNTYNPGPYLFHRGLLARLVERLGAAQPRALYLDLNLSVASQEPDLQRTGAARFPRSAGDQALLRVLTTPRRFPVLLSQPQLFGEPVRALPGSLCWVRPDVITDRGDTVRRIPRRVPPGPSPAAEALALAATPQGFHCQASQAEPLAAPPSNVYRSELYGEPVLFHRVPSADSADYGWPGLSVVRAGDLLDADPVQLEPGAVVVVGRTDRASQDQHASAVGQLPGITLHLDALMTLLTYHHTLQPVPPLLAALAAFLAMLVAMLAAPLLSGLLARALQRLGLPRGWSVAFEHPLMWALLFLTAFLAYRSLGRFLDYALPILSLELSRLALHRQTGKLVTKTLKLAKLL